MLTDTADWALLNTAYVPDSAYQYVTIGNFFEDSLSSSVILDSNGGFNWAYVFVDDVCVSLDPEFCTGHNGFNPLQMERVVVYPNPVAEKLHVVLPFSSRSVTVSIHDIAGRLMGEYPSAPLTRERILDVSDMPEGVYILHVADDANSFAPVRFVHVAH